MARRYPSKTSYGLLTFIFVVFYAPLIPELIWNGYSGAMMGLLAFLIPVFGFIVHMFFGTVYTISDGKLHIKCGFISYRPVDIAKMKEISKTSSFMSSPAPSFDRIEIRYGKFDSVIISPKDQIGVAQHLTSINPNIKNNLMVD